MKVAVVGSRGLKIDFMFFYVLAAATEIVSGGAKGVDRAAKAFAEERKLKYKEFLPDYKRYGIAAPIKRNDEIIDYADLVVVLWDGKSRGTKYVIDRCKKNKKSLMIHYLHVCEDEGIAELDNYEYLNFTSLSVEQLKSIVMAELDKEDELIIDTKLIDTAIDAILEYKFIPLDEVIKQAVEDAKRRIKEEQALQK